MEESLYRQRINCVIDYIENNIYKKLTLNELAKVGNFSKYHFHRIFKIIMGETLNDYIKRVKMEKIYKRLLTHKTNSLTDLAYEMGYASSANFSRDVYNYFNSSPSEIRKVKSYPIKRKLNFDQKINISFSGIQTIREEYILYDRINTGYNPIIINAAFKKLYEFFNKAYPSLLISQFIGIGYDDPDYTPPEKCRYDACISIKGNLDQFNNSPFNIKKLKGGNYAVFLFEGQAEQFFPAWDIIFHSWLVKSQYIPDNRPHLEMYLPSTKYDQGIYKANLCLPIKKYK